MALAHSKMDCKLDTHFGFKAQDNVEDVPARPFYGALFTAPSEGKVDT